jgi:RNA-directed DNA polymerase
LKLGLAWSFANRKRNPDSPTSSDPAVHTGGLPLKEALEKEIIRKSKSILRQQKLNHAGLRKNAERYQKRTGLQPGTPDFSDPDWWSFHPHFNPKYCIAHAKYLSSVIWKKLKDRRYAPIPAIQFDIPKPDGSSRQIMAFAIPDSALANIIHKNATVRNANLFSSNSFAYRSDKNVFDAILHVIRSLDRPKSYIIQYDFSKYFDSIDQGYIKKIIGNKSLFLLSHAERSAMAAFLQHEFEGIKTYKNNVFSERDKGVPQGSSLSLFLSNIASHQLDLALENQNGTFVRFADDVVAITHSYTDALAVAEQFRIHCHRAGLTINYEKSPGIMLFGGTPDRERRDFTIDRDDGSELRTIDYIDFLGHRVHVNGVSLPEKSRKRIKAKISSIIHKHLFLHRRGAHGAFNVARIGAGFADWDLVTCINEIRKYIYGGLRESHISDFLDNDEKLPFIRGLMAFFPLHSLAGELKSLDGWLASALLRAQAERVKVLAVHGQTITRLSAAEMLDGSWYKYPLIKNDARMPSFIRAWRAARKYYFRYGLEGIRPPSYYSLLTY